MSDFVYLKLKAQKSGDIAGIVTAHTDTFAGFIECLSFEHSVATQREAGSARATGERRYDAVKIRKRIDEASPLIAQAMAYNENCQCEFYFVRPSPAADGTHQKFYTIKLTNAKVSAVAWHSPDMLSLSHGEPPTETISFVFQKISWEHADPATAAEDDWAAGRGAA